MLDSIKSFFGKNNDEDRDLEDRYMHYEDFLRPNIDDPWDGTSAP